MKLTKIGIALAAVLAMSGLAASTASALTFNSSVSPVMLLGAQNTSHKLTVDGQNVECTSVTFEKGSQATPVNAISGINGIYNGCTAFGFGANVNMGTCTYTLSDKISVVCNSNASVNTLPNNGNIRVFSSVFGSECEMHVSEQNDKITLNYSNNTPNAGKVRTGLEVTGITVNKTKDNGLCPLSGTGVVNNATYNGTTDVEGTSANIAVN